MKDSPPHITDWSNLQLLKCLGVEPGKSFDFEGADPATKAALLKAPKEGMARMLQRYMAADALVNGWRVSGRGPVERRRRRRRLCDPAGSIRDAALRRARAGGWRASACGDAKASPVPRCMAARAGGPSAGLMGRVLPSRESARVGWLAPGTAWLITRLRDHATALRHCGMTKHSAQPLPPPPLPRPAHAADDVRERRCVR